MAESSGGAGPGRLLRNLMLLAGTGLRHLADDPLLLVVQTTRRLPAAWRGPLSRTIGAGTSASRPTLRGAIAEFVADRPAAAAALAERCPRPRSAVGRGLLAELAVHVGLGLPEAAAAGTRAREAWNRGDVLGAIAAARSGRSGRGYAARLASERRSMAPGSRLTARAVAPRRTGGAGGLRVLHVLTNSVPHTHSGYAVRSHEILRAQREAGIEAAAVTRIGYPVTVGLPRAGALDVLDAVPYHRLLPSRLAPLPGARLQQMVDAALPVARRHGTQVLHTTTNYTNALVTEALARSLEVPWVYEVRGMLEETWLASRHPSLRAQAATSERYRLLRAKETEMMLAADHVVALSAVSRAELVARGVPAERITVVPNAIDAALLERRLEPAAARARLGLPAAGFWVGSVSSLVDYEGFDVLLRAVALLRAQGQDVRVALAGDGVSRPELLALVTELGIEDAVHLPGRIDRAEAWLWHRALDVLTVPRRDLPVCRQVTPLKPIEAMAAGRPVIASDLPALAEIVQAPGAGVVVAPEDPGVLSDTIRALATDPGSRSRYGVAGREFAATRTWQRAADRYRKVYEHVGASR